MNLIVCRPSYEDFHLSAHFFGVISVCFVLQVAGLHNSVQDPPPQILKNRCFNRDAAPRACGMSGPGKPGPTLASSSTAKSLLVLLIGGVIAGQQEHSPLPVHYPLPPQPLSSNANYNEEVEYLSIAVWLSTLDHHTAQKLDPDSVQWSDMAPYLCSNYVTCLNQLANLLAKRVGVRTFPWASCFTSMLPGISSSSGVLSAALNIFVLSCQIIMLFA